MTKKLSAVLILVVLAVSCMALPAMAEDLTWTLYADKPTVIEAEHILSEVTENPEPIPKYWVNSYTPDNGDPINVAEHLSNGYLYYNTWISNPNVVKTYEFEVISSRACLYDIEFVANGPDGIYSDFSIYVNNTLVGGVKRGTANVKTPYTFKDCDMRIYTATAPLSEGSNKMSIVVSNGPNSNAGAMDYIKFTPSGEKIPFAVSGFEDNSVDPKCLSICFTKPVTNTTGITVTSQSGSATIAVDANDANRVKITGVAGRTTITVPADFTGGTGETIENAYTKEVFAYPFADTESDTYVRRDFCNTSTGKIKGSVGSTEGMMNIDWCAVLAVYDGDKMVASTSKKFSGNPKSTIELTLGEGVKFTEAKIFSLWNVNGEWIPLDKPTTRTAALLGFTFAE